MNGLDTHRIRLNEFPSMIDIGCGNTPKEGCIGIDVQDFGQEIVTNIDNGIPLPDSSVEYIYSSHFVEHMTEKQIEFLFLEMVRILKNDGIIEVRCPHDKTIIKYYTCHFSNWNKERVEGIVQGWKWGNGVFTIEELRESDEELFFTLKLHK